MFVCMCVQLCTQEAQAGCGSTDSLAACISQFDLLQRHARWFAAVLQCQQDQSNGAIQDMAHHQLEEWFWFHDYQQLRRRLHVQVKDIHTKLSSKQKLTSNHCRIQGRRSPVHESSGVDWLAPSRSHSRLFDSLCKVKETRKRGQTRNVALQ